MRSKIFKYCFVWIYRIPLTTVRIIRLIVKFWYISHSRSRCSDIYSRSLINIYFRCTENSALYIYIKSLNVWNRNVERLLNGSVILSASLKKNCLAHLSKFKSQSTRSQFDFTSIARQKVFQNVRLLLSRFWSRNLRFSYKVRVDQFWNCSW